MKVFRSAVSVVLDQAARSAASDKHTADCSCGNTGGVQPVLIRSAIAATFSASLLCVVCWAVCELPLAVMAQAPMAECATGGSAVW